MSFNIDTVLRDMLSAMKNSVDADWGNVEGYAKQVLENEKEMLSELAEQFRSKKISKDELESELVDEQDTLEAEMKAHQVMIEASVQRAVNAAIGVLSGAIKAAIQPNKKF